VLTTVPAGTSSAALDCAAEDPLRGKDDLDQPLVACGLDKSTKYVLAPAFLTGREVAGATAIPLPERGGYGVGVTLTDDGARVFGDFTMQNVNSQVAITVDTTVVSAPLITSAIPGGDVQISGDFTKAEAEDLANKISRR
jgi:preprotein translocase subunit SecD